MRPSSPGGVCSSAKDARDRKGSRPRASSSESRVHAAVLCGASAPQGGHCGPQPPPMPRSFPWPYGLPAWPGGLDQTRGSARPNQPDADLSVRGSLSPRTHLPEDPCSGRTAVTVCEVRAWWRPADASGGRYNIGVQLAPHRARVPEVWGQSAWLMGPREIMSPALPAGAYAPPSCCLRRTMLGKRSRGSLARHCMTRAERRGARSGTNSAGGLGL